MRVSLADGNLSTAGRRPYRPEAGATEGAESNGSGWAKAHELEATNGVAIIAVDT